MPGVVMRGVVMRGVAHLVATAATLLLLASCGSVSSRDQTVTVYSTDGLSDWYTRQFAAFTEQTGIRVQYVESGPGGVVSRLLKERDDVQADVVVTLPPYVQQAAAQSLVQPGYAPVVNNYFCFVRKTQDQGQGQVPSTYGDLLAPAYAGKIRFSTPGQAGDGTAMLLQLEHVLGTAGALDYLRKLNPGRASSTAALLSGVASGTTAVANADVQLALTAHATIFFPKGEDGTASTFAIPYVMGLAAGAPHADNGRRLAGFLLSAGAQAQVAALAHAEPVLSGTSSPEITAALSGVEVWTPDWTTLNASVDAYRTAFAQPAAG